MYDFAEKMIVPLFLAGVSLRAEMLSESMVSFRLTRNNLKELDTYN